MANGNEFTQEVTRWVPIVGQWDLNPDDGVTYRSPQAGARPYGLRVSNVRISKGSIRFEFRQSKGTVDGRVVIGYKSPGDEYFAIGLGGYGEAYTITHFDLITGWKKLVGAGKNETLSNDKKSLLSG